MELSDNEFSHESNGSETTNNNNTNGSETTNNNNTNGSETTNTNEDNNMEVEANDISNKKKKSKRKINVETKEKKKKKKKKKKVKTSKKTDKKSKEKDKTINNNNNKVQGRNKSDCFSESSSSSEDETSFDNTIDNSKSSKRLKTNSEYMIGKEYSSKILYYVRRGFLNNCCHNLLNDKNGVKYIYKSYKELPTGKVFKFYNISFSKEINTNNTYNINPCDDIRKIKENNIIKPKYEYNLLSNDIFNYFHAKAVYITRYRRNNKYVHVLRDSTGRHRN